jgi:hypothetical protein
LYDSIVYGYVQKLSLLVTEAYKDAHQKSVQVEPLLLLAVKTPFHFLLLS